MPTVGVGLPSSKSYTRVPKSMGKPTSRVRFGRKNQVAGCRGADPLLPPVGGRGVLGAAVWLGPGMCPSGGR